MPMRDGQWVSEAELFAEEESQKALDITTGAEGYVAPPDVTAFEGIISPEGTVGTKPPPVDTRVINQLTPEQKALKERQDAIVGGLPTEAPVTEGIVDIGPEGTDVSGVG